MKNQMFIINRMIDELVEAYKEEDILPFPNNDVNALEEKYKSQFNEYAHDEFIKADFDAYWAFIAGLSSGGIRLRIIDSIERSRITELLKGSFIDWYPYYRFLDGCDLSQYKDLDYHIRLYEKFRFKLLDIIEKYESMM